MTTLKKPTKKKSKSYHDFFEVQEYLEKLHGKDFGNYSGKTYGDLDGGDAPYQNFWHWLIAHSDMHNGSWMYMPEGFEDDPNTESWVKEILGYFKKYLGDDFHEKMWVEW